MYVTGICIVHYVAQIGGNELPWAPYSFAVFLMLFAVCSSHLATVSMIRGRWRCEISIHTSLEAPAWIVEYLVKVQNVECEVFHTFARWSHDTRTKQRHLRYAPYSASGVFEDMEILLIRAPKRACMKLGRMYILACSTAARLIVHLSVSAKTREWDEQEWTTKWIHGLLGCKLYHSNTKL
jgi:hypothetical protein